MAKEFITLVEKSKHDNYALLALISFFEPKLNKCLYETAPNNREDLRQDLLIKLINTIEKYDVHSVPGFWEIKNQFDKSIE